MNIEKRLDGTSLTVTLSGSLGSSAAPDLEASLADLGGVEELIIDLASVEYLSSAGLRVLLLLHKKMSAQGKMKIRNVSQGVMDIFKMAGFTKFLLIEQSVEQ